MTRNKKKVVKKVFQTAWVALLILMLSISFIPNRAYAADAAVEIVLYTGDSVVDPANLKTDLLAALAKKGIDPNQVKYTDALTTVYNATDTFAWTVFDHTGNWGEDKYPDADQSPNGSSANKHIIVKNNGKNLTFYGYGRPSYKDFMFMPNEQVAKKTFTFDLNEAGIKSHSMEGGGFLFNSKIDNGVLSGYAILFTEHEVELFEIAGVNADQFHNEEDAYMKDVAGIKLLRTFDKSTSHDHSIKIEVTPEQLDMWDNSNHSIDAFKLPKAYGNGFGPIASYNPHDCDELSFFTFNNLKMSQTLTLSIKDVLGNAKWAAGSNKYLVNLADKVVPELADQAAAKDILANMSKNKVNYIGWGTGANKDQALDFIKQNNNMGIFVENGDMAKAVEAMATSIYEQLKADVAGAKAALSPILAAGDSNESITKNITLPVTGSNGTTVSWSSSNPDLLSTSGVVKRPANGDEKVTLTATISKGGISETKEFVVTLKKREELVKTGSVFNTMTLNLLGFALLLSGFGTLKLRFGSK